MIRRHENDNLPSAVHEPQRERVSFTEMPLYETPNVAA